MLKKIKSPRFWGAVAGVIAMILQAVGIKIPAPAVNEILSCVAAALVLFGFIEPKNKSGEKADGDTPIEEGDAGETADNADQPEDVDAADKKE